MSSKLKLSGQTARVILQGNDSISSDQTFTFPDTGGEVATKPAGTPPAVGYQQGIWLPDFASDGNVSSWITKGLTQNASGGDTSHLVGEFSATFSRIGQMVTLQALIRFDPTSGTAADGNALAWHGLPYAPSVTNQRIITNPGFSTNVGYMGSTYFSGNTSYTTQSTYPCFQAYIYTSNPYIVTLTKNGPTVGADTVRPQDFGPSATQYHMMTISYRTDDTTWVPDPDRTTGVTP